MVDVVKCEVCKKKFKVITNTHLAKHDMACEDYMKLYPGSPMAWNTGTIGVMKSWSTGLTKEIDPRCRGGRKRTYPIKYCEICGSKCKGNNRFCSHKCQGTAASLGLFQNGGRFKEGYVSPRKDKFLEDIYGEERASEIRDKFSRSHLGKVNAGAGNNAVRGKVGFRKDLGKTFRSKWEANYARVLNYEGIIWEYESKECRFKLGDLGILILDFYLPDFGIYVEVKGKLEDHAKNKLKTFINLYLGKVVKILDGDGYKILTKKYRPLIPTWER